MYIDGANPSFIKSLKLQIGEEADYDQVIARYGAEGLGDGTQDMKIVPVNFNSEHKGTAVDSDGTLDKESTSYNDIIDAFRLALKFYHYEEIT